jgi:hypothetical protein
MKTIWLTSLVRDEAAVKNVLAAAKAYGLDAGGHFWTDDLEHMAWLAPRETLAEKDTSLWVILGSRKDLETPSVRYGLGLLALSVQGEKGAGFPVLWLDTGEGLSAESLPTPFQGADIAPAAATTLGAKLTAKANVPPRPVPLEYRFAVHANPGFGIWFEAGPGPGHAWSGALLGTDGGAVDAHGVGPAGEVPEKATLRYPVQGLQLALGDRTFTAWAVQNPLDDTQSYYAQVKGTPESLLFGPYTQEDEAEVHRVTF